MSLDINHLALLARLELTHDEKQKFADQLSGVLGYFEKLKKLDTNQIKPTSQVVDMANVYRNDEVKERQPEMEQAIIDNFPDKKGRYDKVNKIL